MFKKPSLGLSLIPIAFLIIFLSLNVIVFGEDASWGPNQIALFCAAMLTAVLGVFVLKYSYKEIEAKAIASIEVALHALMILLIVGPLISLWILGGVIPTMIYYGVDLINPTVFLPVSVIICAIVSMSTGSSWSTVGTIGIALIGIGKALNIPEGMVAGAIVSGSYFGDKMSPLSDTTNLAPAMAGTDLFSHIRHMVYTTVPAIVLTILIFLFMGFFYQNGGVDPSQIENLRKVLWDNYNITLWPLLLPIIVFILVKKKVPALPALFIGSLLGIVVALVFQSELLMKLADGEYNFSSAYKILVKTAYGGFESKTGDAFVDKLLSRGGMSSMLTTVWLILMAMIFGGMLEVTGMLQRIADAILNLVKGVGSLVGATIGTALFLNLTTSDQYISIVVTGRMFKKPFADQKLSPKNLSRAVEDGATVTSVLVPWNTCGAFFSTALGVGTLTYAPYAFFNLLCPLISILIAVSGKTMERIEE